MNSKPKCEKAGMWRRLAEERLADGSVPLATLPGEADSARILHELLVHQVELELQNEELMEARAELEANSERFTELYDFAPVGYFSLSAKGQIKQLNLMAAQMLGGERAKLLKCRFSDFLPAGEGQRFDAFCIRIFAGEKVSPCEVEITRQGESPGTIRLTGVLSPNGQVCRIAAMDVTEHRKAEAAANERNEDLNRIFDLSSDLMGIATMAGRFVRINPAFQRLLGHTVDELTGREFFDFVHPDDREATVRVISGLKAGRDVLDFVNRYRCQDGSYRWLEWRATQYRGELICTLARDITTRKQTEDALRGSEEKFRSIFECSPMAMYCYRLGEDGRLILSGANPAADRETGIAHGSLYGKTLEEAFPALVGTDVPQIYKGVAGGTLGAQSFVIRYDDERIAGHFDVRVFQTGRGTIVVAFMDISDRMKVQDELKESREELELRVQRRTAQLQERTGQLRALASELTLAEERERRRIAKLIHDELQQMLVAAVLNVGMLKTKMTDEAAAAELDHVERILRDSIDTTRSLTTELSPAVLHQCGLAAALNWLRPWGMEKYGLTVEVEADEGVSPELDVGVTLFQCVRELLFNVVKHSGVKSAGLRMWQTPHEGEIRIEVSDDGNGFDPKVVRAREGTTGGFGLFNIRERLELLGGGLEIESAPGCGSRFMLRVPSIGSLAASAMEATSGPMVASPYCHRGRKIRLLVADDHAAVRKGLVRMFQVESDMEVVGQAADGEEALQLARALRPHFVVMDLNMPRMDGLQATAAIRNELPCVKVLGLSTYADEQHRAAMIRAGAVDLLHKNAAPSQLVATLRDYSNIPCCTGNSAD
jgi:PAS domain S-box-containing protein